MLNAKARYLLRRAALLLGIPIPPEAERKYLRAVPVRYWMPPGYDPTKQELVAVRKLCRDSGRAVPEWAQLDYPNNVRVRRGDGSRRGAGSSGDGE